MSKLKRYSKKGEIFLSVWLIWCFINFMFAPLPLLVMKIIYNSDHRILFSSYLSYIFSVLVVSAGTLYYQFKREKLFGFKDVIFWTTLIILFIIATMFISYNMPNNSLANIIDNKLDTIFPVSLFVVISYSIIMHWPYLNSQINEQLKAFPIKKAVEEIEEIKQNVMSFKSRLEKEENL